MVCLGKWMLSNMNIITFMVRACVLGPVDAVEHQHYCSLGMRALAIGSSRMYSIMIWACALWEWYALENELILAWVMVWACMGHFACA